jgi:hypothetical protein
MITLGEAARLTGLGKTTNRTGNKGWSAFRDQDGYGQL